MTTLNESQRRSFLLGCLEIHRRLAAMEALLAQSREPSAFSPYTRDLTPTEARVVQHYFSRLRTTMLECLTEAAIPLDQHPTSVRRALQCETAHLHAAVAALTPEHLSDYGPVDAAEQAQVIKIRQELQRLTDRLGAYLQQGLGHDLPQRLARLEATSGDGETLLLLDRIITRWGLIEFRPQLDLLARRLEAPRFEIAVFGRVNCGKSSLLNHLVGRDVLPVGVAPVTAVPTRLTRGEEPAAVVAFEEVPPRAVPLETLADYAAEHGNPCNHKHVRDILVRLPAPRLREGIVLVDTPGVGPLAPCGSAETFAYLPQCDLGAVLIEATAALTAEDLDLLRLLAEAGTPAQVLLSKADLLPPAERPRKAEALRAQLRQEVGLDLAVHPVSTVGAEEALLLKWFDDEIEPLFVRHRCLAEASVRRKIAYLHESVQAVLQMLLARRDSRAPRYGSPGEGRSCRQYLEAADTAIRQAQLRSRAWLADAPTRLDLLLHEAAQTVVAGPGPLEGASDSPVLAALQHVLAQRNHEGQELLANLQRTLVHTLEILRQAAPLVPTDVASVRDLLFRGLPAMDLVPLRAKLHWNRPWWSTHFPNLAARLTRRALRRFLGPLLREQLKLHDRHLQTWLKANLSQLVELYEAQAEVFREQARRLSSTGNGDGAAADWQELEADLRELRRSEAQLAAEPVGAAHRLDEDCRR